MTEQIFRTSDDRKTPGNPQPKIGDNPRRVMQGEEYIEPCIPKGDRAVDVGLRIGAIMADGTVFAGISPRTDTPMYVMPRDAPLTMDFENANKYAASLDAYGHRDWRLPQLPELAVLFNNRTALGGFSSTGSESAGRYWSSWRHLFIVWGKQFGDGSNKRYGFLGDRLSLRCVRTANSIAKTAATSGSPASARRGFATAGT
jgi:hypothetical protein